jgi:hypothetical protein
MGRLRLSLLSIITIVFGLAMAFAALRTASNLWFSAVYTFSVVLLLWAVIAARYRRGREGAFWFGFAVFGWGFFLLGSGSWLNPIVWVSDEGIGGSLNRNLLTAKLVLFLVPRLRMGTNDLEAIDRITANTIGISYLLITLSMATCGGIIAALLRKRRGKTEPGRLNPRVAAAILLVGPALGVAISASDAGRPQASYFGDQALDANADLSPFLNQWYSKHLAEMNEPILSQVALRDHDATVYRWLWLPSFKHPICVRMTRKGDRAELRLIVLDRRYSLGQAAIERTIVLRPDQWEGIAQRIKQLGLWRMPTYEVRDYVVTAAAHTQLIWEGAGSKSAHVVVRKSPIPNDYQALFVSLLNLSGVKTGEGLE